MNAIQTWWAHALLLLFGAAASFCVFNSLDVVEPRSCRAGHALQAEAASPRNESGDSLVGLHEEVRTKGLEAIPLLLDRVRGGSSEISRVAGVLTSLGPSAVPKLLHSLEDEDEGVRLASVRCLQRLGPRFGGGAAVVVSALVKRLRDQSTEVRYGAVLALGAMPAETEAAVPALTAVLSEREGLSEDDFACMQQGAAHVLGKAGPKAREAVPSLVGILKDRDSQARDAAALALWRISKDTNIILQELTSMLGETNGIVQLQAATALRRISRDMALSPQLMAAADAVIATDKDVEATDGWLR